MLTPRKVEKCFENTFSSKRDCEGSSECQLKDCVGIMIGNKLKYIPFLKTRNYQLGIYV